MTIDPSALFMQDSAADYTAKDMRRLIEAVSGGVSAITSTGGFAVTEKSGGANMSVDVAPGQAFIHGSTDTDQSTYLATAGTVTNVALTAADATHPRIDIIIIQVNDDFVSANAGDNVVIMKVDGTAAASPSIPATPDDALLLATVAVAASPTTSIVDANITDSRTGVVNLAGAMLKLDYPNGKVVISDDLVVDTTTLVVDSTNNRVGIGDATPSYELDVNGTVALSVLRLGGHDFSDALVAADSFIDSDARLMSAAAINDLIVGKGYTTTTGDITGVTAGTNLTGGGSSGSVTVNLTSTITGVTSIETDEIILGSNDKIRFDGSGGDDYLRHNVTNGFQFIVAGSEAFRIDANEYLHAGGSRLYMGIASNDYISFSDSNDGAVEGWWSFQSDGDDRGSVIEAGMMVLTKGAATGKEAADFDNNTTQLMLTSIHDDTHVSDGHGWATSQMVIEDEGTADFLPYPSLSLHHSGGGRAVIISAAATGNERIVLRNSGNTDYAELDAEVFNTVSSLKSKTQIVPLEESVLDKVKALEIIRFRRKNNANPVTSHEQVRGTKYTDEEADALRDKRFTEATQAEWDLLDAQMTGDQFLENGVDADNLAALFPEAAAWDLDENGEVSPYGLNVSSALFTLWKAFQELSADFDALKQRRP